MSHSGYADDLKPCPFCGNTKENYFQWSGSSYGTCNCGAGYRKNASQNAYCWKLLDEKEEKIKKLREALENIQKHQWIVAGDMAQYSTIIYMVKKALQETSDQERGK